MLPPQAIQEFKELYKEEFRENISDKDALEMATGLIHLFKIIYKPIPKE